MEVAWRVSNTAVLQRFYKETWFNIPYAKKKHLILGDKMAFKYDHNENINTPSKQNTGLCMLNQGVNNVTTILYKVNSVVLNFN